MPFHGRLPCASFKENKYSLFSGRLEICARKVNGIYKKYSYKFISGP